MAIVIHTINPKKNQYAYHHYREGGKVKTDYIGPVGSDGKIRSCKIGDCDNDVKVGTTTAQLKELYKKVVKKDTTRKAKPKPKVKEPAHGKKIERIKHGKSVVTAKRVKQPDKVEKKAEIKYQDKLVKDLSKSKDPKELIESQVMWHEVITRSGLSSDDELMWKSKDTSDIFLRNREAVIDWRVNYYKYVSKMGSARPTPWTDSAARKAAEKDIEILNHPNRIIKY